MNPPAWALTVHLQSAKKRGVPVPTSHNFSITHSLTQTLLHPPLKQLRIKDAGTKTLPITLPIFQSAFRNTSVASTGCGSWYHLHLFPEKCQYRDLAKVGLQRIITSNLEREKKPYKTGTVLGNGESEGMLVVTEPDDIIYLKSLRAPLDVSAVEITTCGFCEFSWFLFLS